VDQRHHHPDDTTLALLREMSRGRTLTVAAGACHISTTSAARRLRALRRQWAVRRNIQLVVLAIRRGPDLSPTSRRQRSTAPSRTCSAW
jgi:hypothetical protein